MSSATSSRLLNRLHLLNYFHCVVLLYFFTFTVYYHEKYARSDDLQVAAAVFERSSNVLTLVFCLDAEAKHQDIFLVQRENETRLQLETSIFSGNGQILIWSSEVSNGEKVHLTAEHSKSALLEEHTGRPLLEISPQEPYTDSHDVITCMTPISMETHLDLLLTSLTASISMGSFVNLPYSVLSGELYKFLRIWEKSGNLRLSAHPILRFPDKFRDSAVSSDLAQLHCWLMYRSRTRFLVFQEPSDIVVPVSDSAHFSTYYAHFSPIFELPRVSGRHHVAVLEWNARITVARPMLGEPFADFSVQSAMESARVEVGAEKTKTLIVKTDTSNPVPNFKSRAKMFPLVRSTSSESQKVSRSVLESMVKTLEASEESDVFWTLLKSCSTSSEEGRHQWRCSSGKCIRPVVRHRSLQGWYSYDIHFSQFLRIESYNCPK